MLELKRVTKRFGGVIANEGVSFSLQEGEIVGLIGPNGAGKSTLFHMISGVFSPSDGEILFQGTPVHSLSSFKIASLGISRTFQNLQVFKTMTCLENVMVGLHRHSKSGLLASALRLPFVLKEEKKLISEAMTYLSFAGLEHDYDRKASDLDLGRLRLLELARALATKPKLLLLDEIAAGLNHKETREMAQLIVKVKEKGVSVFVVEHDMDLVMGICDKVIVLDQGRKIAEGPPKDIQHNEQVIEAYLGAEMEGIG